MTVQRFFSIIITVYTGMSVYAQSDNRSLVRKGNALYLDSMFVDAETNYREAIKKNNTDPIAHFNLGNALLRERNPKDAAAQYEEVVKRSKNSFELAKSYHNLGVIFQSQKQYGEAISNYENALRNNPHDDESRYNLALCRYLQKNQKNNQDQNKQQNQNEKRDDKQQDKPHQNNQNKQQDKQPSQNSMSKDNAERLLDVAKQEERQTQEKLRKGQQYATPHHLDKNW